MKLNHCFCCCYSNRRVNARHIIFVISYKDFARTGSNFVQDILEITHIIIITDRKFYFTGFVKKKKVLKMLSKETLSGLVNSCCDIIVCSVLQSLCLSFFNNVKKTS